MLMNILLGATLYPSMLIIFFVMNGQSEKNKKMFFGVHLYKEMTESEELQKISGQFKKEFRWLLILFLIIPVLFFLTRYSSIQFTLWMLWFLGGIVAAGVPYTRANKKTLALKQQILKSRDTESTANQPAPSFTYHEIQIVRTVKPIPFLLGILISVAASAAFMKIDFPAVEVYRSVAVTFSIMELCFFLCARWMDRLPSVVISEDSSVNISYSRARKTVWKNFWLQITWINTAIVVLIFVTSWLNIYPANVFFLLTISESFLAIFLLILVTKKNRQIDSKYDVVKDTSFDTDDDRYWIFGMFYNNPSDRRTMVEKRFGIGLTTNMATKTGKVTIAIGFLALVWIPFMCLWMILEEFTPMHVFVNEEAVVCMHLKEDYSIPLDSITEVELMDQLPLHRSRISGTGTDTLEKGNFQSSFIGSYRSFVNPTQKAFVLIKTADKHMSYLVSGENEAETVDVYEKLISKGITIHTEDDTSGK